MNLLKRFLSFLSFVNRICLEPKLDEITIYEMKK